MKSLKACFLSSQIGRILMNLFQERKKTCTLVTMVGRALGLAWCLPIPVSGIMVRALLLESCEHYIGLFSVWHISLSSQRMGSHNWYCRHRQIVHQNSSNPLSRRGLWPFSFYSLAHYFRSPPQILVARQVFPLIKYYQLLSQPNYTSEM